MPGCDTASIIRENSITCLRWRLFPSSVGRHQLACGGAECTATARADLSCHRARGMAEGQTTSETARARHVDQAPGNPPRDTREQGQTHRQGGRSAMRHSRSPHAAPAKRPEPQRVSPTTSSTGLPSKERRQPAPIGDTLRERPPDASRGQSGARRRMGRALPTTPIAQVYRTYPMTRPWSGSFKRRQHKAYTSSNSRAAVRKRSTPRSLICS